MRKFLAIFAVIAILLWGGWKLWYAHSLRAVDSNDSSRITVTIPAGTSAKHIAVLLKEKDVIRSSLAFSMFAKRNGKANALQAGSFVLRKNMTPEEILEALTSGAGEVSVTIPEGFTVKDIDALLVQKGLSKPGEIIECANACDFSTFEFLPKGGGQAHRGGKLEGYLYPDTYFATSADFVSKFFLERLLGTFRSRVIEELKTDIEASGRSLHEIITMASLIEEETRTNEERPIVAGILWKRYDEGMGLYVDASNRYIADKPTETLTTEDLEKDTPYNLRKYRGLPPGPIANPSLASIKAALHPRSSPYYYYLHGNDGVIRYAVTNDEHNANKAKYLR